MIKYKSYELDAYSFLSHIIQYIPLSDFARSIFSFGGFTTQIMKVDVS